MPIRRQSPELVGLSEGTSSHAGVPGNGGFDFAVEIDFQGKRGGIEHGEAVLAAAQVALYFPGYLRFKASFEIFANQTNRGLTCHTHSYPLEPGAPQACTL